MSEEKSLVVDGKEYTLYPDSKEAYKRFTEVYSLLDGAHRLSFKTYQRITSAQWVQKQLRVDRYLK